ncbi:hypothetical protein [uncultured Kordia sp.]|uniref:hypothetical protein n=1 Tax=uncultured Kordia sp. TaxID=507699 RepID=UPI00262C2884|nr:hypothetical protein [uncultured Kordia sp.]
MKKRTLLIIALICITCFQSCNNDDNFDTRTVPNLQTQEDILRDEEFIAENFGGFTTGNFFGVVQDLNEARLNNVQVTIGNKTTFTDRNGIFLIKDADVYENFAYIKTKKEGYLDGSRVVIPKLEGENRVIISMYKKEIVASINSGEFSTVSLPNRTKVNFSGGFVRQNGTTYNGQVDVVLNYLQPNSVNTFRRMPGSLFAQTTENNAVSLETLGMMSINLFSPSGEELNINQFNRATLEFPITTTNAPDFIPLWYFDEERGFWKQEGQAVRFSNMYVAEVSHFTWWNCDLPLDFINACFSLSLTNTDDAVPYHVIIKRAVGSGILYYGVMTANEGIECGLIPRNEEIRVEVYRSLGICGGAQIHTETLGGYATDTTINVSFSHQENQVTNITGMATSCDGSPITNGYIYINDINTFVIDNGIIDISVPYCDDTAATIQLFDFDSNQWTIIEDITLTQEPINLGNISACDASGGIFNGNLILSTQQEVNEFGAFGITSINGNLTIGNENNNTDIVDLSPLTTIVYIAGDLKIAGNENLTSLQSLGNITNIEGDELLIKNNSSITSLAGFDGLSSIHTLTIDNNNALTSLVGFSSTFSIDLNLNIFNNNNLTSLLGIENFGLNSEKNLRISNNDALESLQGVESISQIQSISIEHNDALNSLTALQNLTQIVDLDINDNDALTTLVGLEQITEVRILLISNNDALENLNGLDNLVSITPNILSIVNIGARQWENFCDAYIDGPNPNLTDFCAIQTLINSNEWNINGNSRCAVIVNNAYNPTLQDFLDGNCSQ